MKSIFQLGLLCLVALPMQAQQVMSADGIDHYKKNKRLILDKAHLDIFYQIKFLLDSTKVDDVEQGQTVLRVSDRYTLFTDYYRILHDSINDLCAESRKNAQKYKVTWDSISEKRCYLLHFQSAINLERAVATVSGVCYANTSMNSHCPIFNGIWRQVIPLSLTSPARKPLVRMPGETMWPGIPKKSICPTDLIFSEAFPV